MKNKNLHISLISAVLVLLASTASFAETGKANPQAELEAYLKNVFDAMDTNYYLEVSKSVYDDFVKTYTADKLVQANSRNPQTENFIHLGGGLLVQKLKHPDDIFTNLIPPAKTKEFKEQVYAMTIDLGIKGFLTDKGFQIEKVQKHSNSYAKGIRAGDIIIRIDGKPVISMDTQKILELLKPEADSVVELEVFFTKTGITKALSVKAETYFEETVSVLPTEEPWIFAVKISHFNKKTSDDFAELISDKGIENIRHFILDLRDNTGGPPLAARELLGFFTPANDSLFFIVRKHRKPFQLNAPTGYPLYEGPLTLLVNKRTGSAAETFSGVLQTKKTAKLVGQKTAGGAYLKSIYDFDDGSALIMVTSRTYFHNKTLFPNDGIVPDIEIPETDDALQKVVASLRENTPVSKL